MRRALGGVGRGRGGGGLFLLAHRAKKVRRDGEKGLRRHVHALTMRRLVVDPQQARALGSQGFRRASRHRLSPHLFLFSRDCRKKKLFPRTPTPLCDTIGHTDDDAVTSERTDANCITAGTPPVELTRPKLPTRPHTASQHAACSLGCARQDFPADGVSTRIYGLLFVFWAFETTKARRSITCRGDVTNAVPISRPFSQSCK